MSDGDPQTGDRGMPGAVIVGGGAVVLVLLAVVVRLDQRARKQLQLPPTSTTSEEDNEWRERILAQASVAAGPVLPASAYRLPEGPDCSDEPRKVLAFYYPWFSIPMGAGGRADWLNWQWGPPPTKRDIGVSTRCPVSGPYDSYDQETIDRHCRWAKEAGIDGWIISWFPDDEYMVGAVPGVLDGCQRSQMTACIHYESYVDPLVGETVAREIGKALADYGGHPAYLKVGGRPVVFVYARAIDALGLASFCGAIRQINQSYPGGVVFFGDRFSGTAGRFFDGLYDYIPAPELVGLSPEQARQWADVNYGKRVRLTDRAGCISTLTVIPGYDDTLIRKDGFKVERHDGALYRALWEAAIEADPHWILVTTFNEWAEGSEIEPSREENTLYLDLTAEYARRFKAALRKAARPHASDIGEAELTALRDKVERLKLAVLPGANSEAIWWLVNSLDVEPEMLSWEDVVADKLTPDRCGVLLHAGDEHYRQTLHEIADVDAAIRRYLNAGGFLVALPERPVPFFYNQDDKEVDSAKKFGLSLENAWDKPPDGKLLHFAQPEQRLHHLPTEMPFPTDGDCRWRPMAGDEYVHYVSLLELRDDGGESHGDAVGYGELAGGGRILYAWFRLLDDPHVDALLHDLFEFIAERAGVDSSP